MTMTAMQDDDALEPRRDSPQRVRIEAAPRPVDLDAAEEAGRLFLKALGIEVTAYAASYALYLFAVFLPQQSLFRLLLPLSPLAGAPGLTRNVRARSIVLAVCVVLQPVALLLLWFLGYP